MSSSSANASALTPAPATPQPPLSVDLNISSPTCSLSGNPPFTTAIIYTCTTNRPIWALIRFFTDFAHNIIVRDPNHWKSKNRRIGCTPEMNQDEWDEEELDREDTVLVRLAPGEKFETTYTFAVTPKAGGFRHSDVHYMKEGAEYFVESGVRRCRWMYEDDMQEGLSADERRKVLQKRDAVEWKPDSKVEFTASA